MAGSSAKDQAVSGQGRSGPLGYKIVFGGRSLPLKPADGYAVENGKLASVSRYSGVEPVAGVRIEIREM